MSLDQPTKTLQLLTAVNRIINQQTEIEKLKGEKFNIFTILGMERYENETHSAFVAELLNPKGSHLMGPVFLKEFLRLRNLHDHIDLETAKVVVEYHIGSVNTNYTEGGRIDIYIWDAANNSVSIENKIDADDQPKQIERYCNHNVPKNKVIYLTKDGRQPSDDSKGTKQHEEHFTVCSYKTDMIEWLEFCIKEAADSPILRETIKQYLILIKKITHTMESKSEQQLIEMMLQYYDEATYITNNFSKIRQNVGEEVRQEIIKRLKEQLADHVTVYAGSPTTNAYSQIWVKLSNHLSAPIFFGVESFSGLGWHDGHLFMGIYHDAGGKRSPFAAMAGNSNTNPYWIDQSKFKDLGVTHINFKNVELLKKYHADLAFKEELIQYITQEIVLYVNRKYPEIETFLSTLKEGEENTSVINQ